MPGFDEAGYPPAPGTARFDEIRPGCYDPVARLADMDLDGVWGQLSFPNYARFAGHRFYLNVSDLDAGLACLRTYNDFLLDEWCATERRRMFGVAILPLHDIDLAVAEAQRVLAKGAKAIAFSENPTRAGPSLGPHRPLGPAVGRGQRGSHPCLHAYRELVPTGDHLR